MATPKNFRNTFEKTSGFICMKSYGGGSPRTLTISERSNVLNLTVEQARDLHYMLTRFLDLHGDE